MTSKEQKETLTLEQEDALFATHYPNLNDVPKIYLEIIDQHRRKKNHMFYLYGNYQDLSNQRYPFNRYAPVILNEGAGPFHWIFVIRNSGKIELMPIHDWEIVKGDANGPRLLYQTNNLNSDEVLTDDDGKEIPIIISNAEIYEKFKKIIKPKMEKSTDWLMPFFEDWLEHPESFRIGNSGLVFLEFIDNLINGTYSDWFDINKTPVEKTGFSVLVVMENASTFFSNKICHTLPQYNEDYAIDLFNKWRSEGYARSSLIAIGERTRSGLINKRILESLAPIEFPFPDLEIIEDWIKFSINWNNAISTQTGLSIPVPLELVEHFNGRIRVPLSELFSEKLIAQLIPKCRGLSLIAIEDLLVSFKIDPKTKSINMRQAIERKKQLIEQEFPAGLIEIFEDEIPLDHVILPPEQKAFIQHKIIRPIERNRFDLAPKGILLAGPSGTGKTLLAKAIASEAGILSIVFNVSNLMSKYVGETEGNTNQALQLFRASKPCIVIMDEADQQMMGRNANSNESDGNTSNRVRGLILEFTSDPRNQGVIFISMTNAPEKIDYAQTRSGRNDYRIPILLPNNEQRIELLNLHLKLQGIEESLINNSETQATVRRIMNDKEGVSGADIELMAKDTNLEWELADKSKPFAEILEYAAEDLNSSVRFTEALTKASLTIASHNSAIPDEYREDSKTFQTADKGTNAYNQHKNVLSNYKRER